MKITVEKIVGWDRVLNSARTTVGKKELDKEPSDVFKRQLLISEHSPIRNLLFEVIWQDIYYWVAMHLARHHIGFHSGEDDLIFIKTQRSDRTGIDRENLSQNALVNFRAVLNAHSIINISRVRLCNTASRETREAWELLIENLREIEPILASLCQPNCIYRGLCPEHPTCGYKKTAKYKKRFQHYLEQVTESIVVIT
jgi:hypothetical protein